MTRSRNWTEAEAAEAQQRLSRRDTCPESKSASNPAAPKQLNPGGEGPNPPSVGSEPRRLSTAALRRLTPEQRLQIAVVQLYRPRLVPHARLLGVNGELPGGGRLQALRSAVRREMGYSRGVSDLLAIRPGHVLWLELKAGSDQSDEQARFADWAHGVGHGYAVVTGIEDAGVVLKIHGMLR